MNPNQVTVQAPGRINIIGEHTDYNDGFVLPAAIDKNLTVKMQRNHSQNIAKISDTEGQNTMTVDLHNFRPIENGWENYVLGVIAELQKLGADIKGFDAEFVGNVPIGSGMSSSAALECSFALALNELFDLGFDKWQLIKASQLAEHNYVGNRCGIMDQFASIMGKKDHVMLLDCRSLDFQYYPLDLGDYELLLLNTNVAHSLASSEYNTRRAECEEGVAIIQKDIPEIESLRDVTEFQLQLSKDKLHTNIFQRCKHVILENQRVQLATKAMLNGNHRKVGELLYASHLSLQNDYNVSCRELDFLVGETIDKDNVLGSRMMGGGFGGCTLNIIDTAYVQQFIDEVTNSYYNKFGIELTPYLVSIEDGAQLVH